MSETNADQSPAASAREPGPADKPGWYWVNRFGEWEPMQTDGNWVLMSTSRILTRITPSFEIGPRIPSPDEACTVPAEPPAGVVELRAALADLNALVTKAQNILSAYLQPDGDTDEAVNSLLYLLDGPEQRQIQGAARDALAKTDGSRQWLSMSTKPTPVTAARRR